MKLPPLDERHSAHEGRLKAPDDLFGNVVARLVEIRKIKGLTQAKVASLCQVTQPTISDIELGKTRENWTTVARMSDVLGYPLETLLIDEAFAGRAITAKQRAIVAQMIRVLIRP